MADHAPAQAYEADSLVLLTSPLNSFLVPFFPEKTRFVGLEWVGSSRLDDLVTATLGSHRGTLMVLSSVDEHLTAESLKRYALTVTDDCGVIRTGFGRKRPLPRRSDHRGGTPGLARKSALAAAPLWQHIGPPWTKAASPRRVSRS